MNREEAKEMKEGDVSTILVDISGKIMAAFYELSSAKEKAEKAIDVGITNVMDILKKIEPDIPLFEVFESKGRDLTLMNEHIDQIRRMIPRLEKMKQKIQET